MSNPWTFSEKSLVIFLLSSMIGAVSVYAEDYALAFYMGCMVLGTCTAHIRHTIRQTALERSKDILFFKFMLNNLYGKFGENPPVFKEHDPL